MKKALVVGASGGMGYSIVKELSNRGIEVVAFARTRTKLEKLFLNNPNVSIFTGDIFNLEDINAAAKGVDVIFQAANIPYPEWEEKLLVFMRNIIDVAKNQSAKLAVVDNIYAYGRSNGEKVTELTVKQPHTKKGKIRLEMEKLLLSSGVPVIIAHFPDFYGPNAENAILHYTLQDVVKNKKAGFVGDQRIAREFIYTPDGAKAIVNLSLTEQSYGQIWNVPGYDTITGVELIKVIQSVTSYDKNVSTITKNMIRFLGLFNPNMREVVEMFYLNEVPVVLNGEKYERTIGPIPRTTYREGIQQTLEFMKANE